MKILKKIGDYFDVAAKLAKANNEIEQLKTQNEFLLRLIEENNLNVTGAEKEKISKISQAKDVEKSRRRQEELEELRVELEIMESIPVAGKSALLQRERAISAHQERILELEAEEMFN